MAHERTKAASLLIRGGHVIDPANKIDSPMDVLLRDGVVAEVRMDADAYAQTHQGLYAYGNQVRIRHALPEG